MTSFPDPASKVRLEGFHHSIEGEKFSAKKLPLEESLFDLAHDLPQKLPEKLPFSGVIAFKVGEGPIVQACHCPNQKEFPADQPFNVLSIGKLFTSVAVMQLIEEGKFALTTPLSELLTEEEIHLSLRPPYFEEKPEEKALADLYTHAREIVLEHLLCHSAGFVDRSSSEKEKTASGETWDHKKIGEFSYSNFGYQLLARIIGKYSDQGNPSDHEAGFRSHIEKRIFLPANMEGAISQIHSPTLSKVDCFKISSDGQPEMVVTLEPYPHGNGGWRMKANDLFAFKKALHEPHVLLREDSLENMLEHKPRPLGFMCDRDKKTGSITGYGHPGRGKGMSSFLWVWRKDPPITAVMLSNYSGCEMVKIELDKIIASF
jgi:CubicO group peptidase (beta-lactamase class C family)